MPTSFPLLLPFHLRHRPVSTTGALTFLRRMGGGPRTFPGGLSKWKYRRMHEKLAREKERRLLDHEKQLYYARVRSGIRAGALVLGPEASPPHGCASPAHHVKALVDRFVKYGAEDLWNEDDGPSSDEAMGEGKKVHVSERDLLEDESRRSAWHQVESFYQCKDQNSQCHLIPPQLASPTTPCHVDQSPYLMKLGSGRQSLADGGCRGSWRQVDPFHQRREYSVQAGRGQKSSVRFQSGKDWDSESDSDCSYGMDERHGGNLGLDMVFPSSGMSEKEVRESKLAGGRTSKSKMRAEVPMGVYGSMKMGRVPFHLLEKINTLEEVQCIREELEKRRAGGEKDLTNKVKEELVFSQKRFDEYGISPLTVKALTSAGGVPMTAVQEAIIPICLDGKDALVKAKAGAGKTAAYLLSAIEMVPKATTTAVSKQAPPIIALIICPTRELASQVAAEANSLLKYHSGIGAQTLIGGTRLKVDQKCLESNPSQIIVATPGRLLDHIEDKSGMSTRLMGLKVVVIDEADHLLELGFRSDLEKIMNSVPRVRQTLMFSSTITDEVRRISRLFLKRDRAFVDTVDLGGEGTNIKVPQAYTVACNEQHFEIVYHLLKEHVSQEVEYKVVIFCTTALVTEVMSSFLRIMKMNVREIHSGKPPLYRTRVSEEFRNAKCLVLVTSDILLKEMQNPNVTLVLQVGVPPDGEEYINRLRVAESEARLGRCISVIAPFEELLIDERMDLHVKKSPPPSIDADVKIQVEAAMQKVSLRAKEAAYRAWLGFYSSLPEIRRDKTTLVDAANKFCASLGLEEAPSLLRRTAIKMGLVDIPGIQVKK